MGGNPCHSACSFGKADLPGTICHPCFVWDAGVRCPQCAGAGPCWASSLWFRFPPAVSPPHPDMAPDLPAGSVEEALMLCAESGEEFSQYLDSHSWSVEDAQAICAALSPESDSPSS